MNATYDERVNALWEALACIVQILTQDSNAHVRAQTLAHLPQLAPYVGHGRLMELMFPNVTTSLNDPSWQFHWYGLCYIRFSV